MALAQSSSAQVPTASGRTSLRGRILRAGGWTLFGHLFGHVLRLASSLIMTRLLVPEMFGVISLAAVIHAVISLLSDIGLRQTIIQSPRGNTPEMLNTAWSLQIARGWGIWALCVLVAVALEGAKSFGFIPASSVYAAGDLPGVIAVTGMSAAIMGFQSTKAYTSNRELNLKRPIYFELIAQVIQLVVMVGLGWLTRSIWSIVAGGIVASLVTVVMSHIWLPGTPNRLAWDRESVRELLGYGRWVLISSVLFVLASSGDRLLLGGWVDAAVLGLYSIALNISTMAESAGARLFGSVTMAALSEVARTQPDRFTAVYLKLRLPFDLVFVGAAGFLFATAPTIVDWLYDARYKEAGYMLQILSFGLVFARYGLTGSAYLALGAPQNLTWVHIVKVISVFTLIPGLYALFGFRGALYAIAFHVLPTLPLMFWLNRRHGLNNLRVELLVLLAWPAGWALGTFARWIVGY